jgi:hypothetical protein
MIVVDAIALPVIVWALVSAAGISGFPHRPSPRQDRLGRAARDQGRQIARGDVPLSVSLVVTLELANLVAIPIWVLLLMPDGVSLQASWRCSGHCC